MKEPNFVFPVGLLNQIDECSNGGYILLIINDNNSPEVYSKCDNAICALALQKYAGDWIAAIEETDVSHIVESIEDVEEEKGEDGEEDFLA